VYHTCLGVWPAVSQIGPVYYGDLKDKKLG